MDLWALDPDIDHLNHGSFGACPRKVLDAQQRWRDEIERNPTRFMIDSADNALDAILDRVTARTRLVLVDHVTSSTALLFPVERLVSELEPEVPVLVDGAHAAGMLPLSLDDLGAAFAVGNCHKWLCAPKGAGYVHVREDHRERMLLEARGILCDGLGLDPPAPDDMIGSMAALPLPDAAIEVPMGAMDPLIGRMRNAWGIEVPIVEWPTSPQRLVRVSAQRYNHADQYRRLAKALATELHKAS